MSRKTLMVVVFGALMLGCVMEGDDDLSLDGDDIGSTQQALSCSGNTVVGAYCMNGVCDGGETYQSCSQDCSGPAPTKQTFDFDAQLFQNGAYDKPIVLIEGFDPADDYKTWNYRYPFTSVTQAPFCVLGNLIPYESISRPPLLGTFVSTAISKGYDVWVVSVRKQSALTNEKMTWQLGDAYRNYLHPYILNYAGYRPYVLSGFSAGGLIARKALSGMSASARQAQIKAYVSIDTPHEGAYIPNALQGYILDHAICNNEDEMGLDPQGFDCHTRFVRYGLASKGALSMLRHRLAPAPATYCPGWSMPSLWNDCADAGGCTLPNDIEWSHATYNPYLGCYDHGSYHVESRSPSWFEGNYGWFTDIPRYAISNSSIFQHPSYSHTSSTHILKVDVNNVGDHHLYNDAQSYQPQKRGALDPFINRMHDVHVGSNGMPFFDHSANLIKKSSFVFVSYDSAFGASSGLTWTGRLTGQNLPFDPYVIPDPTVAPTTTLHENVTADTVFYLTKVIDASLAGATYPGDKGPNSALGNTACTEGETAANAPYDCRGSCGDGICNTAYYNPNLRESCESCATDCGTCELPCCGSCFAAGTPIAMADGTEKPIEQVRGGDLVLGRDVQGVVKPQSVVGTLVHENSDTTIVVNGTILTTPEHPFFANGRYVEARELAVGDELVMLDLNDGGTAEPMATRAINVTSLSMQPGLDRTYNFEVAGTHNYFAGGVLVHNKKACRVCNEQ